MTAAPRFRVGPLQVATCEVVVRTNCSDFVGVAGRAFADFAVPHDAAPATRTVVFDTIRHDEPDAHWSVHRDGEPCELTLRHDAVLVHQQWELNRLAIESQRCAIHAAVVELDGRGVLLAGASHSGKSTLAAWLVAEHGAGFVADEVAAIDEQLRVRPFPRPIGLRAGGPLAAPADADEWTADEALVPASSLGRVAAVEVPVAVIVFPHRVDGHALEVTPLRPAEVLVRLSALTPSLQTHGTVVFDRLRRLVADAPGVELRYPEVADAAPIVMDVARRTER